MLAPPEGLRAPGLGGWGEGLRGWGEGSTPGVGGRSQGDLSDKKNFCDGPTEVHWTDVTVKIVINIRVNFSSLRRNL